MVEGDPWGFGEANRHSGTTGQLFSLGILVEFQDQTGLGMVVDT